MLHLNDDTIGISQVEKQVLVQRTVEANDSLWHMYFDGSSSKEGAGVGVVLISPCDEIISLMYKLQFQTTNNMIEYDAFILGLMDAKDLNIQQLVVFGDSELVVQQVKNVYHVKFVLLKVYRNEVWDLINKLFL